MALTHASAVLRRRNFRLLWIGETTNKLGTGVSSVVLPLIAVTTLEATPLQIGLLAAASWLPWLLLSLHVGAWVDRLPRRPVMVISDGVALLVFATVPLAAWAGVLSIAHLIAAAFLGGAAAMCFTTAYRAYVPSVVDSDALVAANTALQSGEQAAQITGRGLGGLLAHLLGPATSLLADVASFAVSATCLLRIGAREPHPGTRSSGTDLTREIREGLRFTASDPFLRALALFGAVGNLAYTALQTLLVLFLARDIGASAAAVGAVVAMTGVGGLLGAAFAAPIARRVGTARAVVLSAGCTAPFALLIPLTTPGPGLALAMLAVLMIGCGLVVATVIIISFRQAFCPPHLLGRVGAGTQLLNYGAVPVGTLATGALADAVGTRAALWAVAALFLLYGTILIATPLRHHRDLPA
ncbi:MFS transporter [Allokutzneria albata]|uniref:Predicted arabinose efflux permease, MFS family n=1 Tax=Allokutzneria albata TaxID=211114 RepID=A0A1G9SEC9_ALLAB|nr:MFS transporter [Allokutzneria albata]SDM33828.1 Predicted arabinose efflux permease, MFS family [Allokutzneria albata]